MSETESTGDQGLESRLIGWKRISNYLGCSERTARRWEREEQLPVHRQQHERRSTVFALPAELDTWVGSRADVSPAPPAELAPGSQQSSRLALGVFASAVLAVVAMIAIWPRPALVGPDVGRDPIAVDLYKRGSALWRQRGEGPNRQAVKLLTQAVERDDTYAEAWSALATAWITLPTYSDEVSASEATDEALLAADRALQLDATLVEARSVMASVAKGRGDWLSSERIYREALKVDPDNTSLLLWFAGHYREVGFINEAVKLTNAALALEPNSPPILSEIAMNHYQLGHVEQAQEMLDYLWFSLGVETPIVWVGRWLVVMENDNYEAARAWMEKTPFEAFESTLLAYIDVREAKRSDSALLPSEVNEAYRNGLPGWLAFHMLDRVGMIDPALEILDQESSGGHFETSVVLFFEYGGDTRKRAEFADLIERLGFYDYWRARGAPDLCQRDADLTFCQRLSAQ
ncbi:MAG: hypothetical protein AAF358_17575 [Pseudomonadota bacterium]